MKTYKDFNEDITITQKDIIIETGNLGDITVIGLWLKQSENGELYYVAKNKIGVGIQNLTDSELKNLKKEIPGVAKIYDVSEFSKYKHTRSLEEYENKELFEIR